MLRFNEEPGARESGERAGANLDTTPFPFNSSETEEEGEKT